jgi:hypothetical protein
MPGFDGTGPLGQGQLTGGGRGFCVVPVGYDGIQGYPVNPGYPYGANYGGYNAPSYNYPYYSIRGAYMPPIAAGFGYFRRGRRMLSARIGRGRGIRGMGRRF